MKNPILFCAIFLALFTCNKDEAVVVADDDMPPAPKECVVEEMPIATQDSFLIYWEGLMEHGFAEAIKINKEFKASARARIYEDRLYEEDRLIIPFFTYEENSNNITREEFYISRIPLYKGCYKLTDFPDTLVAEEIEISYYRTDADATWASYKLVEEESNFLQIDSLDLVNNYVSGKFMASFTLDIGAPHYETPEYVRFLNGRFECAIIE